MTKSIVSRLTTAIIKATSLVFADPFKEQIFHLKISASKRNLKPLRF